MALVRGRRRGERRAGAAGEGYVDRHGPWPLVAALGVVLLSVADAFLTGILVSHGARELNPLMAWLLDAGFGVFFAVKFVLTAFCVVVLVLHLRFRVLGPLTSYHAVAALLLAYAILFFYELGLVHRIGLRLPFWS